jgi:hypothetical protein
MKRKFMSPGKKAMFDEYLFEKGRYKNCSCRTRLRMLKARIIWWLVRRWV